MTPSIAPTVIIAGASSGVGLYASKGLVQRGSHVVMACRDVGKAQRAAAALAISPASVTALAIDLGVQWSVRNFGDAFHSIGVPLNALVCIAAMCLPCLKERQRSLKDYEINFATNHFGHFLLDTLRREGRPALRLITLGTVTANLAEYGGEVPIPTPADLGNILWLRTGFLAPVSMIDGKAFKCLNANKDGKLCNMMMSRELHKRYHADTGIVFNTLYPGCVADTALFRDTPPSSAPFSPSYQKNITMGYVTQELSGERVAQLVADAGFEKSGVHCSWGNRQQAGVRRSRSRSRLRRAMMRRRRACGRSTKDSWGSAAIGELGMSFARNCDGGRRKRKHGTGEAMT